MPFLDELDPEDREAIEAVCSRRRYGAGEVIFHEGDDPGGVVIILTGRAKATALAGSGKEVVLGFPGPGDLVGEVAVLDGGVRAATIAALEPLDALAMRGAVFRQFVDQHPAAGRVMVAQILARLRGADQQRVDFLGHAVMGRVARQLVVLAQEHGDPLPDGIAIGLPITQEELAGWTGASREAVAKALQSLRELGWIRTDRRRITVVDLEALRRHAG
jgi:CRP/FNR family transcriptional regulator, cyclic AMP receptor protein